ncbi:hexose transporter [Calocera cornea HHB12733]|uniref:Hexose transporter n=1 Tax=Calocera cornea HHB12733 TaxID=1353952 RepID=A0A165I0H4_9BASI|nr:hexose transporter [Calocera cornea HHB12733]
MVQAGNTSHYRQYIPEGFVWYKNRYIWQLQAWILLYLLGNFANGFDGALVNGLQILPEWQNYFNHPTGSTLGLLGAIQNIGSLGSIPVAPLWNDYFGRRKTVMLGGAMMLTGAALQAGAKNVNWFIGGRALLGFGGGFNNNADPLMVIELCFPSHRAPIAGSYNSIVNIGSIVAAATTFGTYYMAGQWSWRLPLLIQVIPTSIQWSLIMFGPESPRWLMGKGKETEALRVLAKYHGNGDEHDPLVLYEFEEIKNAIVQERAQKRFGWTHLFNSKGMRRRSFTMMALAVCGQWSGNSMVSYYLNQVLNTVGLTDKPSQLGINVGLSVWNFFCGFTAGFNADRFGRRRLFLISISGMLLMFTCVTICSAQYVQAHSVVAGKLTVLFIFLFTGFYAIGWASVLLLYVTEIVPFSLRSKGHSLFAITQASMQVFNQYVNPIAFASIGWKYYIVFDCFIVCIGLFVYFFVPETKGHTLEETALMFDGPEAVAELQKQAEEQAAIDRGLDEAHIVQHDRTKHAELGSSLDDKESVEHREVVDAIQGGRA